MAKILQKTNFTCTKEVNGKRSSDLVFYDEKTSSLISYSRIHNRWRYYADVEINDFAKELTNTKLAKTLAKLLKNLAKEAKLEKELDIIRHEVYLCNNDLEEIMPTVMPSGQSLKNLLSNLLPPDVRVSMWTTSPDGPHSINLSKDNDLGKYRDDLVIPGYDDQHELRGSEEVLYKKYCPKFKTKESLSKGLKLTTVEPKYQTHSIGDKYSVTFSTEYEVSIPELTGSNIKKVCNEIERIAKKL